MHEEKAEDDNAEEEVPGTDDGIVCTDVRGNFKRVGVSSREETNGRFCKRAVVANVPLFRSLRPGNIKEHSFFCHGSTAQGKDLLEEISEQGNTCQNHPFGNHPVANPRCRMLRTCVASLEDGFSKETSSSKLDQTILGEDFYLQSELSCLQLSFCAWGLLRCSDADFPFVIEKL